MFGRTLHESVGCLWSIALPQNADAIIDLVVLLLTAGLNASLPKIPGGLSGVSGGCCGVEAMTPGRVWSLGLGPVAASIDSMSYLQVERRAVAMTSKLSGEEAQRVAIARALASRRRIILAD